MTPVALANALLDDRDGASASTPTRGCRPPSCCCRSACRATRRSPSRGRPRRPASPPPAPAAAPRRFRSPHTRYPARAVPLERHLHRGRHQRRRRRQLLPRPRGHAASARTATRDPGSQFLYLRDVRSGAVWSATLPADARASRRSTVVTFLRREGASSSGADDDIATQLEIAVSPEDDVEVRRLVAHQPRATARARSRSRATPRSSLAPAADDLAHPAFGKLFVETEYLPESAALLCAPAAARARRARRLGGPRAEPRGPAQGAGGVGDRPRALPRPRPRPGRSRWRSTAGRSPARPAPCSIPIVSLRQRIRLAPGGFVRLSFATGMAPSREAALALAQKYHDPGAAARTFALAFTHAQSDAAPPRASRARRRCSSSASPRACSTPTARCAPPRRSWRATCSGQAGLWPHGISGDLPILLVRVVEEDDLPLVRQVLQAQEYWRLKGLSADVVILNEHPVELPRRDARAARRRCSTSGPWRRAGSTGRAASSCCAATRMTEAERILLRPWRAPS